MTYLWIKHKYPCYSSFHPRQSSLDLFQTLNSDTIKNSWNWTQNAQKYKVVQATLALYCLPYSSYDFPLGNLVLDQLIILQFIFFLDSFLLSSWYCKEKFRLGHFWELKG